VVNYYLLKNISPILPANKFTPFPLCVLIFGFCGIKVVTYTSRFASTLLYLFLLCGTWKLRLGCGMGGRGEGCWGGGKDGGGSGERVNSYDCLWVLCEWCTSWWC
jgi:hypothetical protein